MNRVWLVALLAFYGTVSPAIAKVRIPCDIDKESCPQGMWCDVSSSWPRGTPEPGPVEGDLTCHALCKTDADCTTSTPKCLTKDYARGDTVQPVSACFTEAAFKAARREQPPSVPHP